MFPTGKILAEKRLQDLSLWQNEVYKALKSQNPSRQVRRRAARKTAKMQQAFERLEEIKNRHRNKKKAKVL